MLFSSSFKTKPAVSIFHDKSSQFVSYLGIRLNCSDSVETSPSPITPHAHVSTQIRITDATPWGPSNVPNRSIATLTALKGLKIFPFLGFGAIFRDFIITALNKLGGDWKQESKTNGDFFCQIHFKREQINTYELWEKNIGSLWRKRKSNQVVHPNWSTVAGPQKNVFFQLGRSACILRRRLRIEERWRKSKNEDFSKIWTRVSSYLSTEFLRMLWA